MTPFRIFIGFDPKEISAYHVLSHSILMNATCPVSITPLRRELLPMLTRKRGPKDSTEFAISRFLVPYLCDYEGTALFMDCDMLMLGDVHELYMMGLQNLVLNDWDVACVQHDYTPRTRKKFLGNEQTIYYRKNWSSVMLFNNANCRVLTEEMVNKASGLDLHQFTWTKRIGNLEPVWNNLIGESCELPIEGSKCLHYTLGGPWFGNYENTAANKLWLHWANYPVKGE